MENKEETFDVRSDIGNAMNIICNEKHTPWENKGFVSAYEGKSSAIEEENEENSLTRKRDYTTFWRKK